MMSGWWHMLQADITRAGLMSQFKLFEWRVISWVVDWGVGQEELKDPWKFWQGSSASSVSSDSSYLLPKARQRMVPQSVR